MFHCLRREVGQLGLPNALVTQRVVMLAEKVYKTPQITVKMGYEPKTHASEIVKLLLSF